MKTRNQLCWLMMAICFIAVSCKEEDKTPELVLENTVWIDNTTRSPIVYTLEFGDHGLTCVFSADYTSIGAFAPAVNCVVTVTNGKNIVLKKLGESDIFYSGTFNSKTMSISNGAVDLTFTKQ
ncbi:MAG: hypothetical protein LBL97_04785 [Prevotellaceae bacterium]|jgi:hypothetical protein|nr:hypothetical protein [Prevotellaceae bacterium]